MKKIFILFFFLAGTVFSDYVPGEVLVKLKGKKTGIQSSFILSIDVLSLEDRIYKLKLKKSSDIFKVIDELMKDPNVEYAEPNYIRKIQNIKNAVPNDPYLDQQWGLRRIRTPEAWNIEKGGPNVIIAILDTGIDYNHFDIDDKIIGSQSFVASEEDPMDYSGHGTHVSGIVGAEVDNGTGCAGVAWNCKLLAIKCLDKKGNGEDSNVYSAIKYAADYGAKVINMSFGGTGYSKTLKNAVDYAHNKNVLLVAAAGNSGGSQIFYPAGYENVMAVAATDINDRKAYFSQYGYWVDIAAPGVRILSTSPNNKYLYSDGTSMASPFVSGVAGLMFSRYLGTTNTWVFSEIKRLSDRIDIEINGGILNAYKTLCGTNTKPSAFSLIQPAKDSWISNTYPLFKWQRSYDPDWGDEIIYKVFLGVAEEGMKEIVKINDSSVIGDHCFWIPSYKNPLSKGRMYNWMVVVEDSSGGTYSTSVSTFTTTSIVMFPNPAKNGKTVRFRGIPLTKSTCFVSIYTLAGELVEKIPENKGEDVLWNTKPVASGVYLYIISNSEKVFAKGKIGVIK
ncbi:TPA: hypothetical protein DCX16_02105 [bacterium]|nr:hypothetical protein [bacterium]